MNNNNNNNNNNTNNNNNNNNNHNHFPNYNQSTHTTLTHPSNGIPKRFATLTALFIINRTPDAPGVRIRIL
jgi:hypothetical protein